MLVCRLCKLQEESRTVLPTPSVAGVGRSSAATAERIRAWQSRSQGRPVRGQLGDGRCCPRATATATAATGRQCGRRDRGARVDARHSRSGKTATGTVLLAQPERDDRGPGEGHIRDGEKNRGEDHSAGATVAVDNRTEHHDR